MKIVCPTCNVIFKVRPARLQKSKNVYCCAKCYYKSLIGSKRPKWVCEKIREVTLGSKNPFYGKKHSKENLEKMSQNRKGKYFGKRHHRHHSHHDNFGENALHWKGGEIVNTQGYVLVYRPEHPYADIHGNVRKHRLIVEEHLKRILNPTEVVHHIDKNLLNNSIENLYLFETSGKHSSYHHNPIPLKSNLI